MKVKLKNFIFDKEKYQILSEIRSNNLLMQFKTFFPKMPDYVFNDMFNNKHVIDDIIENMRDNKSLEQISNNLGGENYSFIDINWKLEVLELKPNSFNDDTQRRFVERQFGFINPYNVPNDEKRMKTQK